MIEQSPQPAIDAGTAQLTAIIRHRPFSRYADPARISHGNAEPNVDANSVRTQKLPIYGSSRSLPPKCHVGLTGTYSHLTEVAAPTSMTRHSETPPVIWVGGGGPSVPLSDNSRPYRKVPAPQDGRPVRGCIGTPPGRPSCDRPSNPAGTDFLTAEEADQGVGRGPGGPPHRHVC
jgi:hypothetical protein